MTDLSLSYHQARATGKSELAQHLSRGLVLAIAAMLVAGCGKAADPAATQVAAKVGKNEISVHQINFVLQRQPNLKPEQVDVASGEVLERLIDQELAVQKSVELKFDQDPTIVQALESARREILARAYVERVGASVSKPADDEVRAYYESKPALFKERRIYTFVDYLVQASQEQANAIQAQMKSAKSVQDVIEWIRKQGMAIRDSRSTSAAEALPLTLLDRFAAMKNGQAMVIPGPGMVRFVVLENSASEPKTLEQARGAIEMYLTNESKRKAVDTDIKALRTASTIEYAPKFAKKPAGAASGAGAAASASQDSPLATEAAATPAPASSAAEAADISGAELGKGLSGLK